MKKRLKIADQIIQELKAAKTVAIGGHMRPDGDCIGSELAVTYALTQLGKTVTVFNQDKMPEKLAFLDPKKMLSGPKKPKHYDCVVVTDCATYERLGTVRKAIGKRGKLINIDHHASNSCYGDINWIDPNSASSGELIFNLIKQADWPITPLIADCLFTAISTDTGSFQYATTRPSTYHTAAELVTKGANLARICEEVYQSYPLSRVKLQKHLYNSFKLIAGKQIAYFWIRQSDYNKAGAIPDESEGLIDHIRDIQGVKVACLFEEIEPEITRISLRSKLPELDVSTIAVSYGGGGHQSAAGARIPGKQQNTQHQVLSTIKKALAAVKNKK
ncbi:MAG: bifunctional oligoribonuclease/PAP phosphatase NrnA [Verrucomicrobiota bacterium]|nr:bifunctional oligoribonuclease/PAP phosphatase NrnA [Verrucomicrobiota bacterium]